jgi:hypothetical protein
MWNVKTNVMPLIIGATGTTTYLKIIQKTNVIPLITGATGTTTYLKIIQKIPHELMELQKPAILGTAHTLRKVLM